MTEITKTYNLPKSWPAVNDANLKPSNHESINEKIKGGITVSISEAGEKASQLANNWKTLSKQQLHDLLTSLITNGVYDSERDPEDTVPLEIPIDDYVVNYLEVYAAIRKTTPEHALMIFYGYDETFPERYGHAQTEVDP